MVVTFYDSCLNSFWRLHNSALQQPSKYCTSHCSAVLQKTGDKLGDNFFQFPLCVWQCDMKHLYDTAVYIGKSRIIFMYFGFFSKSIYRSYKSNKSNSSRRKTTQNSHTFFAVDFQRIFEDIHTYQVM